VERGVAVPLVVRRDVEQLAPFVPLADAVTVEAQFGVRDHLAEPVVGRGRFSVR
jgi:hypothetical protein